MTPGLLGLSHVALSVRDRHAARHFWVDVLGFELVEDLPEITLVLDRGAGIAVALTDHAQTVGGSFDEHHVGLDHLALAVADVGALLSWEQRLSHLAVPHSGITETDAGHHLNLRAPDDLPIEMFVMKPAFASTLGLDNDSQPVAVSHR